jgi:DNA mismatch repair ATPase MutS
MPSALLEMVSNRVVIGGYIGRLLCKDSTTQFSPRFTTANDAEDNTYISRLCSVPCSAALSSEVNNLEGGVFHLLVVDSLLTSTSVPDGSNKRSKGSSDSPVVKAATDVDISWTAKINSSFWPSLASLFKYLFELGLKTTFSDPILDSNVGDNDNGARDILCPDIADQSGKVESTRGSIDGAGQRKTFRLHPSTAKDLDVFTSSDTGSKLTSRTGPSLLSLLDQCISPCGSRCLRSWLSNPLTFKTAIIDRQLAAQWMLRPSTSLEPKASERYAMVAFVDSVKAQLRACKDVGAEALLTALHHRRLLPRKFTVFIQLAIKFRELNEACSTLLSQSIEEFPCHLQDVVTGCLDSEKISTTAASLLSSVNIDAETVVDALSAHEIAKHPELVSLLTKKAALEHRLAAELQRVRKLLQKPTLQWKSLRTGATASLEYLIEIPLSEMNDIRKEVRVEMENVWKCVSATKTAQRFHTPQIQDLLAAYTLCSDEIANSSRRVWQQLLQRADEAIHGPIRKLLCRLGELDVYLTFGKISTWPGYSWPTFDPQEDNKFTLVNGRHPLVEHQLSASGESFIPNDVTIGCDFGPRYASTDSQISILLT